MSNHFIKNIEIKNFKCFEDFKAEGFGRVNLIGGQNNVGKTAFMEACLFNTSIDDNFSTFIDSLILLEYLRDLTILQDMIDIDINQYIKLLNSLLVKQYINTSFTSNINYINININFEKKMLEIDINDRQYTNEDFNPINMEDDFNFKTNFISSLFIDNEQLISLYDKIKTLRKRNIINQFIQDFDNNIVEYDIINSEPKCFSEINNEFINLSEYGNGLKRYIAYVCAIWTNQDGYIFIDEIENGIHYTHLDKLWEIILKTSREANVQVFATTHSKECIESYARVAERLEDEEITFIELGRNDDNEIDSIIYPYKWLIDEIEKNHEVRGW